MNLKQWYDTTLGRAIDVDGAYGAQCVDLANDYVRRVHGDGRFSGNAIDAAGQRLRGAIWIANTPNNYPSPGDVVVWSFAPYGHIAVVLFATPLNLVSLDQNWNSIARAEPATHDYRWCLGWHHWP